VARSHPAREIEIKLRVPDAAHARRKIRQAGFRISPPRVFESNLIYDTPELALRRTGTLLRIRKAGRIFKLTYKGPDAGRRHKSREELEIEISNGKLLMAILERLGFAQVFRYEKFRTEFEQPGARGTVTLDETPIGFFLELEGAPRWIDRTARLLGFAANDYILASYGGLYLEFRKTHPRAPRDMVLKSSRPAPRRAARPSAGPPPG
jgi:predicted adenylyl cyclase CyaB